MTWRCAGGKPHVLMVDDIADVVELTKMLLEGYGYTVVTAGTGAEALAVLDRERVDVAVIDLGLPDMDGADVATSIKQCARWSHIKTIAMTGDAGADAVQTPSGAGFDAYVIKPFSGTDLIAVIEPLCGQN